MSTTEQAASTSASDDIPFPTGLIGNFTSDYDLLNFTDGRVSAILPGAFQTLNVVVRFIEGCLAIMTNGLTIAAITKYRFLRSNTNMLVCSLAAADFMAGIGPFFLIVHRNLHSNPLLWLVFCATEQFINGISYTLNGLTIVLISLDRCLYINFPLRYATLVRQQHMMYIIIMAWLSSILILIVFWALGLHVSPNFVCRGGAILKEYALWGQWTNYRFLIETSLIFLLYCNIGYVACKQKLKIDQERNAIDPTVLANRKNENKITKMMGLVLGVILACYMPQIIILLVMGALGIAPLWLVVLERVSSWIWWINSWVNPFIYAWKNKEFNRAFRLLLGMNTVQVNGN